MLGRPSDVLLKVGVENKPLKFYGNKIIKKQKKHGFELSDLKNLPNAMVDPIAIFEGNRKGSFAVLTEIKIKGNSALITLEVGKGNDVDFNIITSTYAKTDGQLSKWVDAGLVLYVNKNRAPDYLRIPATLVTWAQNNQELHS